MTGAWCHGRIDKFWMWSVSKGWLECRWLRAHIINEWWNVTRRVWTPNGSTLWRYQGQTRRDKTYMSQKPLVRSRSWTQRTDLNFRLCWLRHIYVQSFRSGRTRRWWLWCCHQSNQFRSIVLVASRWRLGPLGRCYPNWGVRTCSHSSHSKKNRPWYFIWRLTATLSGITADGASGSRWW